MAGATKALRMIQGVRLIDRTLAAVRQFEPDRVIAVGPAETASDSDVVVREDPPFSGPRAALAAALPSVTAEWLILLPCDLRNPQAVVRQLASGFAQCQAGRSAPRHGESVPDAAPPGSRDGLILVDDDHRPQWLAGIYRTQALCDAVQADGKGSGSLHSLLAPLALAQVFAAPGSTTDMDTEADYTAAVAELERNRS